LDNSELANLNDLEEQFDVEMARELVAAYLEDTDSVLDQIQAAIIDRDAAALKSVAHMLKGASRIITAKQLEQSASELEELSSAPNWLVAETKYETLKQVFEQTIDYLRVYIK
jgi:HPt (histidine-containing phosphotransfer) domain-containing protein